MIIGIGGCFNGYWDDFTRTVICGGIKPLASRSNGVKMTHGAPGPITKKLMDLWASQVQCDWVKKSLDALKVQA